MINLTITVMFCLTWQSCRGKQKVRILQFLASTFQSKICQGLSLASFALLVTESSVWGKLPLKCPHERTKILQFYFNYIQTETLLL